MTCLQPLQEHTLPHPTLPPPASARIMQLFISYLMPPPPTRFRLPRSEEAVSSLDTFAFCHRLPLTNTPKQTPPTHPHPLLFFLSLTHSKSTVGARPAGNIKHTEAKQPRCRGSGFFYGGDGVQKGHCLEDDPLVVLCLHRREQMNKG